MQTLLWQHVSSWGTLLLHLDQAPFYGITAANKQAPLVKHMEYEIHLPDHDFVIAPQAQVNTECVFSLRS